MQRFVYGRDLYEVQHASYPSCPIWEHTPISVRIRHEKAAQALNVRLGLIAPTEQMIVIIDAYRLVPVSGVRGLAAYLHSHLSPHDRFEAHVMENGLEVGYGWYEVAENKHLLVYEEQGKACDLAELVAIEPISVHVCSLPLSYPHQGGMRQ